MRLVYDKPKVTPTGKIEKTEASRALIYIGHTVLLCRGVGENFLHVPGGHIDGKESPEQGLMREINEEMGRSLISYQRLGELDHEYIREYDGTLEKQHSYIFVCKIQPYLNEMGNLSKESHLDTQWYSVGDISRLCVVPLQIHPLIWKGMDIRV